MWRLDGAMDNIAPNLFVAPDLSARRIGPAEKGFTMRRAYWLALIPFVGLPIGPIVHNRLHPFILGMPFPLGWITVWILLTAVIMAILYTLDPANREDNP